MEEENKNVEADTVVKVDELQEMNNAQVEPVPVIDANNEIKPEVMPAPAEPVAAPEQMPAIPEVVEPATPVEQTLAPVVEGEPAPVVDASAAPVEGEAAPKKKSKLPIILLIIFLLAAVGFAVWFFVLGGNGSKSNNDKKDEPEQEEKEEKTNQEENNENKVTELDNLEVKNKLKGIIDSVRYEGRMWEIFNDLYDGKKGLSDQEKILVVISNINREKEVEMPDKYKENDDFKSMFDNGALQYITFDSFENKYQELFNTLANFDEETMKSASATLVLYYDTELRKIYLHPYGSTVAAPPKVEIMKYEQDNDNYYVYVECTKYETDVPETSTVVWKFDKNYNFISTEVK